MKQALALLLDAEAPAGTVTHPFVGGDKGQGADVSGNIKTALRERFRAIPTLIRTLPMRQSCGWPGNTTAMRS